MTQFDAVTDLVKTVVWQTCYTCRDYALHRREKLAPLLAQKARDDGREVVNVVNEFMMAAHERHMKGEPLREGGPITVSDPFFSRMAALLAPGLFGNLLKDENS